MIAPTDLASTDVAVTKRTSIAGLRWSWHTRTQWETTNRSIHTIQIIWAYRLRESDQLMTISDILGIRIKISQISLILKGWMNVHVTSLRGLLKVECNYKLIRWMVYNAHIFDCKHRHTWSISHWFDMGINYNIIWIRLRNWLYWRRIVIRKRKCYIQFMCVMLCRWLAQWSYHCYMQVESKQWMLQLVSLHCEHRW